MHRATEWKVTEAMAGDNKDELQIRLHVYDTDMSVTAMQQGEEHYRKVAELVTDTVSTYASVLKAERNEKDILCMASVGIALCYKEEFVRNDVTPYSRIISQLISKIEEVPEN